MDWRTEFFTKQFTKKQLGLEIGPSHAPIAAKKDGYNVRIVDHANQADLIKKYKSLKIDTSRIESVDYVWDGTQTLTKLIGKPHSFDYVIASHVIEHTTDVITFLLDCQNLLKPKGRLCLAIPDKRYCFDYFRFPTTIGEALEAYEQKRGRHTPAKVYESTLNAVKRGDKTAWGADEQAGLSLIHEHQHALDRLALARADVEYVDIHNWMFTPNSFRLLTSDLQRLNIIKLSYVDQLPTQGFEFFAILSPSAPAITTTRIELLNGMMDDIKMMLGVSQVEAELADVKRELEAMKQSRRWKYSEKPAQALLLAKRMRK